MDKLPILFSPLQRLLLIYCAFYLGFHCVIRFPSIAPYLVFYCVFSLSFSCVFWKGGGSSESLCLVHPPYALMCLLLWFYCILCDIIDFTVFHSTVLSVLCPVFFFQCIHCLSFYCELCFWDFFFCFLNLIKTVIPFTTLAFAFKSTVKNVNTFTMFIRNLLMSLIAHAENSLW